MTPHDVAELISAASVIMIFGVIVALYPPAGIAWGASTLFYTLLNK